MAKYDHGGGCACGLQKTCDCEQGEKPVPKIELELSIDLGASVRKAMIQGLIDAVNTCPHLREAVIIGLLRDDPITRCIIAEELGEQSLKERDADAAAQAELDRTDFQSDPPKEKSWDEIMLEVLDRMADTPGGRGEVH